MILAGVRRIAIAYVAVGGATVGISALLAVAAHGSVDHGIAVGLYILGALLLVGCFVFGVRGPLRGVSSTGENSPILASTKVRVASQDERSEATRTAIILFLIGLSFVFLGSLIDPTHSTF
jgi:hypothetical protein